MAKREDPSLSSDLLHGFKWSSAAIVLQGILQLVILSVLARLLTPKEFGLLGIAMIFTNFFERVGFLGAGPSIVQREVLSDMHVQVGHALTVLLGLIICVLLFASATPIAAFFGEPQLVLILRVLSFTFLIESYGTIAEALLQRNLRFQKLLVANNAAYLIGNGLVGIGLALLGCGVWSLVAAAVVKSAVKAFLCRRNVPVRLVLRFPAQETRELLRTGFGFTLGKILSILALNGDNFIVGRVLGAAALGMYGRAYQLMTLPATYFGQVLERVLFPVLSKRQSSQDQLRTVFLYGVECQSLIGISAGTFVFVMAPEIIKVLFGDKWLAIVSCLQLLALGMFPRLAYKNGDVLLRSLGAVYPYAARQALYTGLVLLGAFVGCFYGLEGVAVAVTFAVTVNYVVLSRLATRLMAIPNLEFARAHLAGIWCGLWVFLGLNSFIGVARGYAAGPIAALAASIPVCALLFICALRIAPKQLRPKVFELILDALPAERFGVPGRLFNWVLSEAS